MNEKTVNICLHNIVENSSLIKSIYDLTFNQLKTLTDDLIALKNNNYISDYNIFFDDGYRSFIEVSRKINFGVSNNQIHLAIITGQIGTAGKLNNNDLKEINRQGFSIESHSVSHASLALYLDGVLIDTPKNGLYRNMPYGKKYVLSEQEVLYQLKKSAEDLINSLNLEQISFVLPYGLYNQTTVDIATKNTSYKRLYTCDVAFDKGQYLAPRLIVTQENISNFCAQIKCLEI